MIKKNIFTIFKIQLFKQWNHASIHTLDILHQPITTFLTIIVIAVSITLPSTCYIIWKNISNIVQEWYPVTQLTVYLDKSLNKTNIKTIINHLKQFDEIKKINYMSPKETKKEFITWSGLNDVFELLEENPLPAIIIVTPKINFNQIKLLINLRNKINKISGIENIHIDDDWLTKLNLLSNLIGKIVIILGILMIIVVFLVINHSIKLNIFLHKDTINIMKLIGATDRFIMRPFLNNGILLGLLSSLLSLLFSSLLIWKLTNMITQTIKIFNINFHISNFIWDEILLIILITVMITWLSAWLTTNKQIKLLQPK